MTVHVAIIHPWMPQYRLEFFEQLINRLAENDVTLHIYYGQTPPEWGARNDNARPNFAIPLDTRFFNVRGRNLSYKNTRNYFKSTKYQLIILEQAIRNIETYKFLANPRTSSQVAFWGHGRTYTQNKSRFEESIKLGITRRAKWFFGYTDAGVQAVVDAGFARSKTTIVQNTIDTKSLHQQIAALDDNQVASYVEQHDLTKGATGLYIGGVDTAKRIDFLLEAATAVHAENPTFRILVAGDGDETAKVIDFSAKNPYLIYLGRTVGIEKALALRSADFMVNPGRVGLVAVDSLTAGVPIVTTDWPYHAPEFGYLNKTTSIVTNDNVNDYTSEINRIIRIPTLLESLKKQCIADSASFTTESMVERFAEGISQALKR